jgi:F-type H+-transporting ATPase subunit g
MSLSMSRAALRQTTKLPGRMARRFESTTSKAADTAKESASKATETAKGFQSKASEGLSRVTSSAGPALSGAVKGVGSALGKIGGRTGRFVAFVEREYFIWEINLDVMGIFWELNG